MAIRTSEKKETATKANDITYEVIEECGAIDTKSYTKKGET